MDLEHQTAKVQELENKVTDLQISNARLAISVEHLSVSVTALTATVQVLRDTLNQGKGALWLAMGAAGAVGALLATFIKRLFNLG